MVRELKRERMREKMLIGLYDNGILVRDAEAIFFTTEEEWKALVEITKRIYERSQSNEQEQ
jgi:hypothetical protein